MNRPYYLFGRFLQIVGMLAVPSAIWVGHLGHNERGSIHIFLASIAVFFVGWLFARIR